MALASPTTQCNTLPGRVDEFLDAFPPPYPRTCGISRGSVKALQRAYPDGGDEWTFVREREEGTAERISDRREKAAPAAPRSYQEQSAKRAARMVKRVARSCDLRTMWTATFPKPVRDFDEAYRLMSGFLHHAAPPWLRDKYLGVPELHPGGHGYHWHLLTDGGRVPQAWLVSLQVVWTRHLATQGYAREGGGKVRHKLTVLPSAKMAAAYAAKYVTKSFCDEDGVVQVGRHRYIRSLGLSCVRPVTSSHPSLHAALHSCGSPERWRKWYWIPDFPALWLSRDPP